MTKYQTPNAWHEIREVDGGHVHEWDMLEGSDPYKALREVNLVNNLKKDELGLQSLPTKPPLTEILEKFETVIALALSRQASPNGFNNALKDEN